MILCGLASVASIVCIIVGGGYILASIIGCSLLVGILAWLGIYTALIFCVLWSFVFEESEDNEKLQ